MIIRFLHAFHLFILMLGSVALGQTATEEADARPWIRLWWPEQGPEKEEIQPILKAISEKGFGGVEIVPRPDNPGEPVPLIGAWPNYDWVQAAAHAADQCEKLGLQIDMMAHPGKTPPVAIEEWMEERMTPFFADVRQGEIELELPEGKFSCLGAWPSRGEPINLIEFIDEESNTLEWTAPIGKWNVIGTSNQIAGNHLNGFSPTAHAAWTRDLTERFEGNASPRAWVYERSMAMQGNWCPEFYEAFETFRGYDLREKLPAMFGRDDAGTVDRVVSDAYETLADLHITSLQEWHASLENRGLKSRSMIRGQAGNPVDLSSVVDIPGAILSDIKRNTPPMELLFASSGAHLTGKGIIQGRFEFPEHVAPTPGNMKKAIDLLWLGGINQITLDGRSLSMPEFNKLLDPGKGLWENIDGLTTYMENVQSFLQQGSPDPDLLLYMPYHDFLVERNGMPDDPKEREEWLIPTTYFQTAKSFQENGVQFDSVSDRLIKTAAVEDGEILIGDTRYKALILPDVQRMPETTAATLLDLTRAGGRIGVIGNWPEDVQGYPSPDIRRGTLITSLQNIPSNAIVEDSDPLRLASALGIIPEELPQHGLSFIRRSHAGGHHYFIANLTDKRVDQWVTLANPTAQVIFTDPRLEGRSGQTHLKLENESPLTHIVMEPGESLILSTYSEAEESVDQWLHRSFDHGINITGDWKLEFIKPEKKDNLTLTTPMLGSWTTTGVDHAGVVKYQIEFKAQADMEKTRGWILDLGEIAHSGRVKMNGNTYEKAFVPPHHFVIRADELKATNNLEVEVSSLNINSGNALPAGLMGPVKIHPLRE